MMALDSILITIEEFIDDLELIFWEKGQERFRITELFPNSGLRTCIVNRLTMEVKNDMVLSSDSNNVILNGMYVIMMFLKECLVSVHKTIINGLIVGMLEFKDGDITIEAI